MRIRTDIWLVRVSAAALLVMVIWHGAHDLRDAFIYRSATLARIDIGIAVLLLATAAMLNLALQRAAQPSTGSQTSGRRTIAMLVLLMSCSTASATGFQIGLFFYTIAGASLFCLGVAATAAAVIRLCSDRRLAAVGFAAVLYCAAAAAAFQIGAAPLLIALLQRG